MADGLPRELTAAIAAMLTGVSRNELAMRAGKLSDAYRAGRRSDTAISDPTDVLAYVVARMPATYAAIAAALRQMQFAAPDFVPASILDVGAGPGTASFAATAAWPDIGNVTMIDSSRQFVAIAGRLAAASDKPALGNATHILADAARFGRDLPEADLVIAAYALAEIGDAVGLVALLWRACGGALVLVEPGTPDGFERIRTAREALIAEGAAIAAPCPHARPCPIMSPDWCHFAERLSRSRDHRLAKAADAPFEDEKFSYVVATRPNVRLAPYDARVLAPPRSSKAAVRLKLCTNAGTIAGRIIPKRDRAAAAALRRVWWGDAVADEPRSQSGSHGPAPA